ncbi:MAG: hypothetical protein ABIH67_01915 [Candidatus Uhrbacteria bacterium]
MNDALRVGKKAFTIAIAAATILWTVGIAALVVPTAQAVDSGDLIKGETLSTVYYYSEDGTRYIFTTEKGYFSWYEDFSGVTTITDEELADIPLGGNIVYRPGSRWIKVQSNAKTYAVTPDGAIRWIETEDVAVDLAGDDWNQFIDDVPDVYFADYTEGTSIMDGSAAYEGALVSGSTYLIWGGEKRLVTDDGFTANGFQTRFLLDGAGIDLDAMTAGDDVTAFEGRLSDTSQVSEAVGAVVVEGDLTFSLASDTPAGASIPEGAAAVKFLTFDVSGTGSVSGMVFNLGGVGTTTNLSNVYLYEGLTRLTDGRSVNASTRQITFNGLSLELAGSTRTFTVRADISSTSDQGDTATIELSSADSITTSANVAGAFPIGGNVMTMAESDAGTVTITKNGNPSNPSIGQDDATIAKINIAAASEDASIEQIAFTVKKASDHSNYRLYQGSDELGTGTVASDVVTFNLSADPFTIEEGQSRNFDMKADVAGDAGDTLKVTIPNDTDLMAIGSDFGFNMAVVNTAYDSTSANCDDSGDECSFMDLQGGQLTVAYNGPSAGSIEQGGKDVVLMEFTITAEEYMTIKDLYITMGADDDEDGTVSFSSETGDDAADDEGLYNSTTAVLTDISVRYADGNGVLMGPQELSTATVTTTLDAYQQLTFTDDFTMEAGESLDLTVTADVYSSALADAYYGAQINVASINAEDINGDAITDIVPSTDLSGSAQQVKASSLTINLTQPPSAGTFVKGTSDVNFVGFSFAAGEASDITVTDITLTLVSSTTADGTLTNNAIATPANHVSSCGLYDGLTGSLIDGPEAFDTTADTAAFSSFEWTVQGGETGQMLVTCDLSNLAVDSSNADEHAIKIAAAANVTATDEDGDGVTPTLTNGNTAYTIYQTVQSNDTITVTAASDTPKAGIILGSSTDVLVSKFKAIATAGYEATSVTRLSLENADGTGSAIPSAVKISYVDTNGDTQTKTSYMSGGTVTFDNIDWYVPASGASYLSAYVDTNNVGISGASSGATFSLDVDADTVSNGVRYIGVGSDYVTTSLSADVEGNDMTIFNSKPTLSLASGSPSGAGIPGLTEVFRFNVSADTRGDVTVHDFTFTLASTDTGATTWNDCDGALGDGSGAEFTLYDLDDPSSALESEDTDWEAADATQAVAGTPDCNAGQNIVYINLNLEETTDDSLVVTAGDTKTLSLYMDTTGASGANDNSIRIDIPTEATINSYDADFDSIEWDDTNGYSSGKLNIAGTYVKTLPVGGGTIIY